MNQSTRLAVRGVLGAVAVGFALGGAVPASAHVLDADLKALVDSTLNSADARPGSLRGGGHGPILPQAVPEINGPGRVSTVGNVWLKTTNIGVMGNPFTANSSDPSGQWPGPSGDEFLFYWGLWVGAKNPEAQDPTQVRRVSSNTEWRPPSLRTEDRIYQSYDGQVGGQRDFDDDGDGLVDEEFLNGKDDDRDGSIDEDYAAISQQMYSCELRDDTEQAVNANFAEKHVPFGLLVRQSTYAFAVPGANDFTAVNYDVYNQSGHTLDSVFVGFVVDQDVGPNARDRYFADDLTEPRVPQGDYFEALDPSVDLNYDPVLCPSDTIHVRGFSMTDDEGDMGRTTAASSFLLLGQTTDPTGLKGPRIVGFRMYRAYLPGTPFVQGGSPTVDLERFQTLAFGFNGGLVPAGIDPVTGLINIERPEESTKSDYFSICSVGPYLQWANGAKISVQVALAVQKCDYTRPADFPPSPDQPNPERYSAMISNALEAQKTFRGKYFVAAGGVPAPDRVGRETGLIAPPGTQFERADCHDGEDGVSRTVGDRDYVWFDFDCNYCTGVMGALPKNWLAAAPPPNPGMRLTPGNRQVTIEWDNLSEITPDPSSGLLDFKAYRLWKASNFTRPVGSSGPSEELWALLGEFKLYDYLTPLADSVDFGADGEPNTQDTGEGDGIKELKLTSPVLLNVQSGQRIFPNDITPCAAGSSLSGGACPLAGTAPGDTAYFIGVRKYLAPGGIPRVEPNFKTAIYPVGRYKYVDRNVLDGFVYFYSVTAKDSTGQRDDNGGRGTLAEQEGRRSAVESQGVTPQSLAQASSQQIYVVPNPYRGRAQWDLTPNAADPTGTHIDFFNMPQGAWTLRIFTINGDLVQTLHSTDLQTNGKTQKETADDGQATWNLISRNGQDIVSGIYMFSVESQSGTARGKFVVIR